VTVVLLIVAYILSVALVAYLMGRYNYSELLVFCVVWPIMLPIFGLVFLMTYANDLGNKHYRN
jgi:hypothetical protein